MVNITNPNKAWILEDAKIEIMAGSTLAQIAAKHSIGERTLDTWLHGLGEEYTELRQAWVDKMLMDAGKEIEDSANPILDQSGNTVIGMHGEILERTDKERLARARELWKRATWYAERRDRLRYGQQVANINIINGVTLSEALAGEAGELLEHISDTD